MGNALSDYLLCCSDMVKEWPPLDTEVYRENIKLGQGAFGEVWRGRLHSDRNQYVAIKLMNKSNVNTRRDLIRNEVSILRKIEDNDLQKRAEGHDSSNLIDFFGAYEDQANLYLVFAYINGGDFADKIKEIGTTFIALREQSYTKHIMSALDFLHSTEIIHRDIKPDNFLVSRDDKQYQFGKLVLCDFGLASDCVHEPMLEIVGSPNYWAPEMHFPTDEGYSLPADMWAAGICLWQLLHGGRLPFARSDGDLDLEKLKLGKHSKNSRMGFSSPFSTGPSAVLKELYRNLLHPRPDERLTAEAIVKEALWLPQTDRPGF